LILRFHIQFSEGELKQCCFPLKEKKFL